MLKHQVACRFTFLMPLLCTLAAGIGWALAVIGAWVTLTPEFVLSALLGLSAFVVSGVSLIGVLFVGLSFGEFTIEIVGKQPQIPFVYVFIPVAVGASILKVGRGHRKLTNFRTSYSLAWVLYLVSIAPSVLLSVDKGISLLRYVGILMAFLTWLLVSQNFKAKYRDVVLLGAVVFGDILALRFIDHMVFTVGWDYATMPAYRGILNELPGFGRSNYIATFFVILLPVTFGMAITQVSTVKRIFCLTSAMAMIGGLVLTFSRGGLLLSALGIVIIIMLNINHLRGWILAIAIMLAVFLLLNVPAIRDTLAFRFLYRGDNSRLLIWHRALEQFKSNWIFGTGLGTDVDVSGLAQNSIRIDSHNYLIGALQETGIVGALGFAALLGVSLRTLWTQFRMTRIFGTTSPIHIGLLVGLAAGLVNGLLEPTLRGSVYAIFFWSLMAIVTTFQTESKS